MTVFSAPSFSDHELVCFHHDRETGLRAIVAVHDTTLGPAVGGCRMYPYACDGDALDDVLRLSRGMTYKSALAGLPLGGGKSVIIGDPRRDKSPARMRAMGRFIDSLGGRYAAAEDSGTTVEDLRLMASQTRFVNGIDGNEHGGDPSPSTARGLFSAIRAALRHRLGSDDLAQIRVAIQGLGSVGYNLAALLRGGGATVLAADPDEERLGRAVRELGVEAVGLDEILFADVDVLAPCALGGVLCAATIGKLRAGIVAGAANNQLRDPQDAARLADRGILYCPDFLINAGGIIDVHHQRQGLDGQSLGERLDAIGTRLTEVLERADRSHRPTNTIAEELAEEILGRRASAEEASRQVA